jgi:hypothetical protein
MTQEEKGLDVKPTYDELMKMLENMKSSYENLRQNAMIQPVTNYDLWAALTLIHSILKERNSN